MNNKMKLWLIIPVLAIVLLIGGTYAWYVWQTSSDEETIIATDVGYAKVFFDGGSDVTGKLKPVSDKSKGMSKEITVSADKEFIEDITFNLYLDINSIDAGLKHESFKFELYKDGTLVKEGNFSDAYLTSALSECTTNEGVSHISLTSDIVTTEESVYTLYTWIDGNMSNPIEMEGKDFDFTLHASGEHAILTSDPLVHNGIIPEGGIYTDYNGIEYTAGQSFPETMNGSDTYSYGDYEYTYSTYYNDWDVEVLDKTKESYGEILNTINGNHVTRMTYTFRGCWALVNAPEIPDSVESMSSTFSGCESLVNAPEIPDSVTYMESTFEGCTSLVTAPEIPDSVESMSTTFVGCTSLTGIVKINSENCYSWHVYDDTVKPITVEVPAGSETYSNLTATGFGRGVPDNVTVTTFVKE